MWMPQTTRDVPKDVHGECNETFHYFLLVSFSIKSKIKIKLATANQSRHQALPSQTGVSISTY